MRGSGPAFPFVWGADLIGSHIRLCNIASRPELNGSVGRVVAAIADSKRFRVRLPDAQEMSVARSKLLRSSEGGWGEDFLGKTVTAHGLVKAAHLNGSQVGEGAILHYSRPFDLLQRAATAFFSSANLRRCVRRDSRLAQTAFLNESSSCSMAREARMGKRSL